MREVKRVEFEEGEFAFPEKVVEEVLEKAIKEDCKVEFKYAKKSYGIYPHTPKDWLYNELKTEREENEH